MQADDIYRFVGLRQPSSVPPGELHDPFIGAYSYQSQPTTASFRYKLATALAEGDRITPHVESLALLESQSGRDAWALIASTFYTRLFLALPHLMRRGDVEDVEKAMTKAFDVSFANIANRSGDEIVAKREKVADYFAACALSGWAAGDFDGAAHLICCFETLERMLAVADEGQPPSWQRAAWRVPLTRGVVVLPFEVQLRQETGSTAELEFRRMSPESGGSVGLGLTAPTSFIGDLIVLKQQLRRYELGEIAHVENVLAKEHLDRTHRTLRRTESKLLTVEETEKEISRDLPTTTRDELSSEIQKTISEQLDLSVNFNVTATYMGPGITVTGSVGGAAGYRRASEERTATAMAHSQEVVSRASEKVRQRTLTQREKIETSETEQTAKHSFQNDTANHIVGVYRWLERCFDLHLVNYGRRLIYEFVIPEPSSYWSALVSARGDARSGLPPVFPQVAWPVGTTPPKRGMVLSDFLLNDGDDLPVRWAELVELAGQWGVTLERPPPDTVQVHFALNTPSEASPDTTKAANMVIEVGDTAHTLESGAISTVRSQESIKIPTGYRATEGKAAMHGWRYMRKSGATYQGFEGGEAHLLLNGKDYSFTNPGGKYTAPGVPVTQPLKAGESDVTFLVAKIILTGEFIEGEVPVLLTTSFNSLTCSIQMECKRTKTHADAWSQKMFSLFAAAASACLAAAQATDSEDPKDTKGKFARLAVEHRAVVH